MSISTPDPTQPMPSRKGQVTTIQLVATLQDRLIEALTDPTNSLTLALAATMSDPPEDRSGLDMRLHDQPYTQRAAIGHAFTRLVGEAWLKAAEQSNQPF